MRSAPIILLVALASSCGGGGGGGGQVNGGAGLAGVWQYEPGSFSFVNCYTTSTKVELTRSGFQIVDEAGTLVRVNPDGCRFTLAKVTSRHAEGVAGEECTVQGTDAYGKPLTTRYRLSSLVMNVGDDARMLEVFALAADQTTTLGTVHCEISGSNTLDRVS